jgi:hypothetical protein
MGVPHAEAPAQQWQALWSQLAESARKGTEERERLRRVWGPPPPPQHAAALRGILVREIIGGASGKALLAQVGPLAKAFPACASDPHK